jgi:hypothetical protein
MTLNDYKAEEIARWQEKSLREITTYVNSKRCGNCDLWNKSRMCPLEKPGTGKRSGYSVGPSSASPTCSSFVPDFEYDIALQVQTMKKLES